MVEEQAVPQPKKIGVLLGVGILIMPYVFSWLTLRSGYSSIQRVICVGWATVFIAFYGAVAIGAIDAPKKSADHATSAAAQAGPPARPAVPPRAYWAKPCGETSDFFSDRSNLTELQKDHVWAQEVKDRYVKWSATVNLIDKGPLGGLQLQFKCSDKSLIFDGHAAFQRDQEPQLARYRKGDTIVFEGRLDDRGKILGLHVADAVIAPEEPAHASPAPTAGSTPLATGDAVQPPAPVAPVSAWRYQDSMDPMRGTSSHFAVIESVNQLQFAFPYEGGSRGMLTLRQRPSDGLNVILSVTKGQFLCSSFTGGHVSVKFDEKPIQRFSCAEPSDASTGELFILGEKRFVQGVKKASTVIIEAEFFQEGPRQLTFNTSGLNWK